MSASTVVGGIKRKHAGQPIVVRLDVQAPSALPWLSRLGVHATPAHLLFDASDAEMWRSVGPIEAERVAESPANP